MKSIELKVARIGNSRGVRLPAATLARYRIGDSVVMEECSDGIMLRPHGSGTPKLSWEATAQEMSAASEDWSDWDALSGDGLEAVVWEGKPARRIAESTPVYGKTKSRAAGNARKKR